MTEQVPAPNSLGQDIGGLAGDGSAGDGSAGDGSEVTAALTWLRGVLDPGTSITEIRPLPGGQHASTSLVRTDGAYGDLVLRLLPLADVEVARHEARVLQLLNGPARDVPAPGLVATDPDGEYAGRPALLITRLPGDSDLTELRWPDAAAELGHALARVHATPVRTDTEQAMLTERGDRIERETRRLGELPQPYASLLATEWPRLASTPLVLTHLDFWTGNMVWQAGRLTGVVDWSGATLAPRGFDLGWCRLDLMLLYETPRAAEAFLHAYQDAAGATVEDMAWWDLHATARSLGQVETWFENYDQLGRGDLRPSELKRRHLAWLQRAHQALSPNWAPNWAPN